MNKNLLLLGVFFISLNFISKAQTALNFDDIDNYVDCGDGFSLTSYTKEVWIKYAGSNDQNNIISGNLGNTHAMWAPGGKIRAGHSSPFASVSDGVTLPLNTWVHYAVSYDGTIGRWVLYRNGTEIVFNEDPATAGFVMTDVYIGAFNNTSTGSFNLFKGQLDDVRIWSTVRTATQIAANYDKCLTGTEPGLVAFYKFEDGVGSSTLADSTGNGNDGTLEGMDLTTDWVTGQGICEGIPPTVVISSTETSPTSTSPFTVTVTFSEDVSGFDVSDLTVDNGSVGNFTTVSATEYTAEITPTLDGIVTIDVAADAGADASGNGNEAATQFSIDYDVTGPNVTITSADSLPTNNASISIVITFDEDVTGFDLSDVSVGNGNAGSFTVISAAEYTVEVAPTIDNGVVTVNVAADAGVDASGNGNEAADELSIDYDTTIPTVALTSTVGQSTNVSPFTVTVTFSEDIILFKLSDIIVSNGVAGNFMIVSGAEYTFEITPTIDGEVTANIPANIAEDPAGNLNEAADELNIEYDTSSPTVAITSTEASPTNGSPIAVTITFDEAVTGFDTSDVAVGNGTAGAVSGSGTTYTADITPTADGVVTVDVSADAAADGAGNGNTVAEQFSIDFDETAPTASPVSIASNNADPSLAAVGDEVTVSFTTSESLIADPVVTIDGNAVTVGGGPLAWTATYTMQTGDTAGAVALTVDFTDTSGNAATQIVATTDASSVTFDETAPTASPVSIASNNADPSLAAVGDEVTVSFTTSESLIADPVVTIDGNAITVGGGPLAWTATYTMQTGDTAGAVAFTIDFTDTSGNAATQVVATTDASSVTFDETAPTASPVSIASNNADPSLATVGDEVTVSFTTSETLIADPVVTIDGNAVTVGGGPLAWTATYTMQTGDTAGAVAFTIDFTDTSGNAATQVVATTDASSVTFDETAPTASPVSIASNNADPSLATVGDEVTVSFTTSETLIADPVVTIDGNAVTVGGGPLAWTATYTMQTGDMAGAVAFTIDFTDTSGNVATQVVATTDASLVTFDETAPTASPVSIASNNADPSLATVGDDVTVSFTTSETLIADPVVTIDGNAVTVGGGPLAWTATYTMQTGDTAGVVAFTIDFTDTSGNVATQVVATTDASSVTFDETAPTASPVSIASNNADPSLATVGDEVTVSFTTSETLIADPVVTIDGNAVTVGGGPLAWTATYTMQTGDTAGAVALTVDFTDTSGNAATQIVATTDASSVTFDETAPTASPVSIASNNADPSLAAVGDEVTVSFTTSESLIADPVVTIDGNAITVGGGPLAWTATYTMQTGDTAGAVAFTIDFTDTSGNAATQVVATTDASSVTFDETAPTASPVSIASNNADPSLATVGDEVTVSFTTSETLIADPVVTIDGNAVTVGGGPLAWTATYTMQTGDTAGAVAFTIDFTDTSGNAATQVVATTDASSVTFDETAPTASPVSIASNNADPSLATVGDEVTVSFTTSETLIADPVVTIDGNAVTVGGGPLAWTATYTMQTGDMAGAVAFTIDFTDTSGNVATQVVATTDASLVTFDETAPTASPVSIASNNADPSLATVGDDVTVSFTTSETLIADPVVTIDGNAVTVGGGPLAWTATYTMQTGDTAGVVAFTIDFTDTSGNVATQVEATTDASLVTFDETAPTASPVSIVSNNVDSSLATVGDEVTVSFTTSETLIADPVVTIDGNAVTVGGGPLAWTATYTMQTGDTAGAVAFTIDFTDTSGNAATQVVATTDASSVTFDGTVPTLEITSLEGSPTNTSTILVSVIFSEDVTGFDASDLAIVNGTAGTFTAVSATEYTVEVAPTADGAVTVDVAADAGDDAAGNGNEAATQFSIDYDGTVPTVEITSLEGSPTNASPILVSVIFSEDVTGFDASDLAIVNGTAGTFTAVSATEYTVEVAPTADGAVTVDVAADAGDDAAGNGNEAATQFSIDYDGTVPTVEITSLEGSPTNTTPILVSVVFSEDVTGFDASDLAIVNGTAGTFTAVSATEYTVEVAPTADGAVTVDVAADAGDDAAGNGNEAATQFSIDYDGTVPTVEITSLEGSPTNTTPILVSVVFSEDVTGFDASDLAIVNGTAGTFTAVSATEYTVEVAPTADGAVTVDVAADAGDDAAGNGNEAATQFSIDYDGTVPTVEITSLEGSPTNASTILVSVIFSEDVTGFDASDLAIVNGTAGTFTAVSATEYTVEVAPTADGAVTVDVAADAGDDAAGNGNEAATQFSIDYDGTVPTVEITSLEGSPTNASPILVSVVFSEDVTGFDASDLAIVNGTAGTFTAVSATEYTVEVAPAADGAVTVDVAADAGDDAAGNGNEAATQFSIDYDGTVPTLEITSLEGSPTNASPILVSVVFSEDVTGFDASDLAIVNGTAGTFTAVSATEYTVEVAPAADGAVTVDVAADAGDDAAGNGNEAATQFSIDYDGTVPTVEITSLEGSPTNTTPILVSVVFSEDVTGFDASDLAIVNGTAGTFTAVSATEYTVEVAPTADGAVTVDVAADAGDDAAGNGNEAATQFSIDYDGTVPTVEITSLEGSPTNTTPILVSVVFSEDVTGFDASDLAIVNGTAGTFTAVSATEYTVEVAPTADGAVTVDVAADAGDDAAGNGNEAATQFSIDYDGTVPTATIMLDDSDLIAGETATVTITFSEAVTGFDNDALTVPNGTLTAVSSTDGGITFTGTFTPTADLESATNIISLNNTEVVDAASNAGVGTTDSDNFTIDTLIPNVLISSSEVSPTNTSPISIAITFDDAVTGFEETDVVVGNGTVTLFVGSGTTYLLVVTPNADGAVTVDIAADVAIDASGNGNSEATQFSIEYDGTSPGVSITSTEMSPTSTTPIPVTITFEESVTGFEISDLVVGNGTATFFAGTGTTYIAVITPDANGAVTVDIAADVAIDASGNGNNAATQFSIVYEGSVVLQPKAFLQGPLLNPAIPGLMNDILREDGFLPTISPYVDALTVSSSVFNLGGLSGTGLAADDIVDWVWVELRDSGDNTNIMAGQSALLQRDGDIVALDGTSVLSMSAAPADYFVVIKHRNHIGTMSQSTFGLTDATATIVDFTDSGFSTFGTDAQVILGSGDKALWAGNVNGDTTIQYAGAGVLDTSSLFAFILNDDSNFLNLPTWSVTGYTDNDVDMNGTTQYTGAGVLDSPYILQNILSYPGNFLNLSTWQIVEQLPENE